MLIKKKVYGNRKNQLVGFDFELFYNEKAFLYKKNSSFRLREVINFI